jgi:hypothetical protein
MFEVYCPSHRSRVLLSASCIEAIHNTSEGPILDWHCWCGARGSLANGRRPIHRRRHGPTPDAA